MVSRKLERLISHESGYIIYQSSFIDSFSWYIFLYYLRAYLT
uniref:Uncharacterized protein n=1 Tax=Klebsiella pneumoniae TaxID=573 RepID=A0A7M1HYB2_KLEPN|nr:hypothetical protein NCNNKFFI_05274 [Klebsiella pneumoniae]